ncbi:MAG TPA: hypothetical protein VGW78_01035 [Candidatus Babeliales bacterium]|jgi:hypothetical protein|nr:hypothetical protein [Candidatus Babeliales bacterium]
MPNINDLMAENNQVAIPREVLMLLRWLAEHHADEIKQLTKQALQNGLYDLLLTQQYAAEQPSAIEESYEDIAHCVHIMETILMEELDEHAIYKKYEKNIQTTIDHIDAALCDTQVVQSSMQKVSTNVAGHPNSSLRDALFKELLRQWRPRKSSLVN